MVDVDRETGFSAQGRTDGEAAGTAQGEAGDLRGRLDLQRRAFRREGAPSLAVRRDRIDRLVLLLTENAEALGEAMHADFGYRPPEVSIGSDIAGMLPDIVLTGARLGSWMRPSRPLPGSGLAGVPTTVERVPLGVVGIIAPWNFPLGLAVSPAAAAFAGGNRVMIKMSEVTHRTAEVFASLVERYFDPAEMTVVTGGPEVGAEFSALPFDHLLFTGSPRVGALVAETAGRGLVPVTLELGGKNPVVVDPAADLSRAAERIMAGRLMNGGQVCLCPEEVFVPEERVEEFVEVALATARAAATQEGGLVSLVSDSQFAHVTGLLEGARAAGATVHEALPELSPDPASRRVPPVVVTGVTPHTDLDTDEVFGPILTVHSYRDIDTVIDRLADRPAPLAAYWFGPRGEAYGRFTDRVRFGGMTVDDVVLHGALPLVPFGGVGRSGTGAYHGRAGFETFTHPRSVTRSRLPISVGAAMIPPLDPRVAEGTTRLLNGAASRVRSRIRRRGARSS